MPRLREKKRLREQRILGIKIGIPIYIPPELVLRGFKLKFYNTSDVKIGEIGSDVKTGRISTVNFELMGLGCAAFSFVIDEMPKTFKYEIDLEDESLVGYWPFDEGAGMVAYDHSKNNNHGTLENMTEADWVDGKVGKCLDFDGVDDYVSLPATQDFAQEKMTFSAWINANNFDTYRGLIYIEETAATDYLVIRCDGDGLNLAIEDGNVVKVNMATAALSTSEWIHVAFVQDGTGWKFYLNGELATFTGTNSAYCTDHLTVNYVRIGYSAWVENFFGGLIDEVLIYKRALTATEIKALYELKVGKYIDAFDMAYRTRVDIHPYFDESPWFTGFIQTIPQTGQKKPFEYTGFGFFDQLDWVTVTGSYENQDVADIVKDIIENVVAPNTQIIYNVSKVQSPSYTVVKIDFDHTLAKDAIQTLADMAQGYEFGVDGSREFYFRPIDTTIYHNYWIGKHFQDAEIEKNPFTVRNKLYIKIGEIQAGGSNIIGSVQDNDSISAHGLREDVINVPESLNPTDAQRWAADILARTKDPEVKAKIKNIFLDETKAKIEAKGKTKITAHDGTEYTFFIKRVAYIASPGGILAELELE